MLLLGERKNINSAVSKRQPFSTIRPHCQEKIKRSRYQNFLNLITTMTDKSSKRITIFQAYDNWKCLNNGSVDHGSHTENDSSDINSHDVEVNEIDDEGNMQMEIDTDVDRNEIDNDLILRIKSKCPGKSDDEIRLFLGFSVTG